MTNEQMWTILLGIGIPMLTGFGWLIHIIFEFKREVTVDLRQLDNRISRIEGYLGGYFGH